MLTGEKVNVGRGRFLWQARLRKNAMFWSVFIFSQYFCWIHRIITVQLNCTAPLFENFALGLIAERWSKAVLQSLVVLV